jgi:Ca2+-binding EF-hand superfamily protein
VRIIGKFKCVKRMRPATAPVNFDSYGWLSPVRKKPLPLSTRSRSSGVFSSGVQVSPLGWKNIPFRDQFCDNQSLASTDSSKLRRSGSLPEQLSGHDILAAPVNSVNARRRLENAVEIADIRKSFEVNYKKYRSPKRINDFDLRYEHWKKYFDKRKHVYSVKITKEDFEKFWEWFESRIDQHESGDGGICMDKLIDDFVYFGVVSTTQEATVMLKQIDSDGSGTISFEELMVGMGSGDICQKSRLKYFLSTVTKTTKKERVDVEKTRDDKKARKKGLLTKLRSVQNLASLKSSSMSPVVPINGDAGRVMAGAGDNDEAKKTGVIDENAADVCEQSTTNSKMELGEQVSSK